MLITNTDKYILISPSTIPCHYPKVADIYLHTCVDHFTRWPEAIPIPDSTATAEQAFLSGWVSRFGIFSLTTTNRGVQFESALWQNLMQPLGTI